MRYSGKIKNAFAVIAIATFLALAGLSIFAMDSSHNEAHGESKCVASTAKGIDCPQKQGTLGFLTFHLDIFKSFSTAVFLQNITGLIILVLLFIGVARPALTPSRAEFPNFAKVSTGPPPTFLSKPKLGASQWLALHENSPSIF